MVRVRTAFLLAAVAALVAVAGAQAPGAAASPATEAADRALDRALRNLVATKGGPPAVIAVVQRGRERRVHRAGSGDLARRLPPRPQGRMRIASLAKAFSGAVALSLVRAGALSLDDTIGERLPDLPSAWHPITLRQLLAHRSGLPDFSASRAFAEAVGNSPRKGPAPRQLLTYVASEPLNFPPGTAYRYSNTDNVVVGLMVEAVTGASYRTALHRRVLAPLGLRRTSLPFGAGLAGPFTHGYERDGKRWLDVSREVAFGEWAWASGGIVSTPFELNSFVRAYVGGRLFGAPQRRAQFAFGGGHSDPPGPGRNSAGLALFRYRTACGTVYGHTGSILGYTQLIAATADGRRSLTFTINSQLPDELIPRLRAAQAKAVCAALAR